MAFNLRKALVLFGLLAFFFQFPYNNALPENNTTWFIISQFNYYYFKILSFFGYEFFGSTFYPAPNPVGYSDTGLIHFLLYLPFRLFLSELWAYYFYLCLVFYFNFITCEMFLKQITGESKSFYGALLFSCSNFVFGNIGDPPVIFYPLFFLVFSILFKSPFSAKNLFKAGILTGLQAFSFSYVYLFLNLAVLGFFIINKVSFKKTLYFYFTNLILASLFFLPYINKIQNNNLYGLYNNKANATIHSFMELGDFFKKIPGNIYNSSGDLNNLYKIQIYAKKLEEQNKLNYIYPVISNNDLASITPVSSKNILEQKVLYHQLRKSGFVGFIVLILSIIGFLKYQINKTKVFFNYLFLLGLFLCIGPYFAIGDSLFKTPLYYFYEYIPYFDFFRVPSRAYMLCLISIIFYLVIGIKYLKKKYLIILMIVALIENIPFKLHHWKYFPPPKNKITDFLSNEKKKVILYLPSDLGIYIYNDNKDVFAFQREYIYMNWKNYNNHFVLNGMSAYLPPKRVEVQKILKDNRSRFKVLKNKFNLEYIYFHNKFYDGAYDTLSEETLLNDPSLSLVAKDKDSYLFRIN